MTNGPSLPTPDPRIGDYPLSITSRIRDYTLVEQNRDAGTFDVVAFLQQMQSDSQTPAAIALKGVDKVRVQRGCPGAGIHLALDPVDAELQEGRPLAPSEHHTISLFLHFALTHIRCVVRR